MQQWSLVILEIDLSGNHIKYCNCNPKDVEEVRKHVSETSPKLYEEFVLESMLKLGWEPFQLRYADATTRWYFKKHKKV